MRILTPCPRFLLRAMLAVLLSTGSLWGADKPNILLITLDSARADRMGFLGAKGRLTPHLDALAAQSLVFEHAYAQAPETLASHAAILTGTYPPYNHVSEFSGPLAAALPYLPDLLHAGGYRTAAFVGTLTLDPRNGLAPGFDRGFETYDAGFRWPRARESRYATVERRGSEVAARALAWLQRPDRRPFFLWVELHDAHSPYQPPPGYASAGSAYNEEIKYLDARVGKLLAGLRARNVYDDAVIIVAGDHGESLGAHGEQTHGVFLYDETIHVPLLLKIPKTHAAKAAPHVRLVDVAPTVLQVAGLPVPPEMQGQSLLQAARHPGMGEAAYARSDYSRNAFGWSRLESWRAGKYLYIDAPKPELYDMDADPGATRNLAAKSQATASTMVMQLLAFDGHMTGKTTAPEPQLSSSELQKLASLGYVGLQKSAAPQQARATGIDPKDEIAAANATERALEEVENGRPEKAAAELQPLLKSHPDMFLAQFTAGLAHMQQAQYAAAIPFLRKAIELQPQAAWAYYEMGEALAHTGDWKGAATHLEIAVARLPEMAEAHATLGDAYQHLGRAADAAREHGRARELERRK